MSRPSVRIAYSVCEECGRLTSGPASSTSRRKTCQSVECTRAHHARYKAEYRRTHRLERRARKHVRRAKLRGNTVELVNLIVVYDRDGWICGICEEPIDPALEYPDPLSVSLDHVIPVSLDGPHSYANTRAAHLVCNERRGNRMDYAHHAEGDAA